MKKRETAGFLALLAGNVIFGFSFLFSRLALNIAIPTVLIAVRFTVAFLVLNLIVVLGRRLHKKDGTPLVSFSLKGKPLGPVLLLALFQPVIYFAAENYGIKLTSSSFAGIMISLLPIAGLAADWLIVGSKISLRQILCALFSIAGVILTTVGSTDIRSSAAGLGVLLIAIIAGALFYVFSSRAGVWYNPLERTYVMFGVGSLVYLIISIIQCAGHYSEMLLVPLQTPIFWVSILYLAVVSSVIAFMLLNFGSSRISVSRASLLANSTTVISILAGVLVLHEPFTLFQVIGALIIVISVTLV